MGHCFSSQPFVEISKDFFDQFTDHRTVGVNWTVLACWPTSEQRTNKNNTLCSVFMSLPEEIQQLFYCASVFHGLMYHKMRSDPSNLIFWLLLLYNIAWLFISEINCKARLQKVEQTQQTHQFMCCLGTGAYGQKYDHNFFPFDQYWYLSQYLVFCRFKE